MDKNTDRAEFPDTIYRVILSAEDTQLKVSVTKIPCKKTAKIYKTIHGKHIKHTDDMVNQYFFGDKIMYRGYCMDEESIDDFISQMKEAAQNKAEALLKRANELYKTAHSDMVVTVKDWEPL